MTDKRENREAQLGALIALHVSPTLYGGDKKAIAYRVALLVQMALKATNAERNWQIRACNYPMSEAQEAAHEKRRDKQQAELRAFILDELQIPGMHIVLGGDPRGACGFLHIEGLRGDGWGDGFAIYPNGV